MYYVMEMHGDEGVLPRTVAEFVRIPGIRSWMMGSPIEVDVPAPIVLDLEAGDDVAPPAMIDSTMLIWRRDLADAVRSCGVDNVQLFPAQLRDVERGKQWDDYFVVNVVGVVSAADLEKSEYQTSGGSALIDVDFDSLAIDDESAHGLKLFRLGEAITAVVVSEDVRSAVKAAGLDMVSFVQPSDWVG